MPLRDIARKSTANSSNGMRLRLRASRGRSKRRCSYQNMPSSARGSQPAVPQTLSPGASVRRADSLPTSLHDDLVPPPVSKNETAPCSQASEKGLWSSSTSWLLGSWLRRKGTCGPGLPTSLPCSQVKVSKELLTPLPFSVLSFPTKVIC